MLRYGVSLPPLGDFADPRTQAALAVEAELAGWDGYFVTDGDVDSGASTDGVVVIAAVACATTRVALGILDTPASSRSSWLAARQNAALDQLSGGRLIADAGAADAWVRGRATRHPDGVAADFRALAEAGATWWLETVAATDPLAYAYALISAGPPRP